MYPVFETVSDQSLSIFWHRDNNMYYGNARIINIRSYMHVLAFILKLTVFIFIVKNTEFVSLELMSELTLTKELRTKCNKCNKIKGALLVLWSKIT